MDQPAESVEADDRTVTAISSGSRHRRLEFKATVRPFLVVVPEVLSEGPSKMALPEDQKMVQALAAHRVHEALGKGVRLRRADGRADDAHLRGAFIPT